MTTSPVAIIAAAVPCTLLISGSRASFIQKVAFGSRGGGSGGSDQGRSESGGGGCSGVSVANAAAPSMLTNFDSML